MELTSISLLVLLHVVYSLNLSPSPEYHVLCDMGCNCPRTGQTMMLLDCSRKGISTLPTSLQFDTSLTKLTFQNNRISTLRMSTFTRADDIEELDFSLNLIISIDDFTFTPFRSLTRLRISHNRLSEVGEGLLQGLENLRILELGHNTIQTLSPMAFIGTPNLQELKLQYNPIFDLNERLFEYLPKLERLNLEDTGLVVLPSEIFQPTSHLQWLSLSNNAFENVPEEALSKAPLLKSLDLSGNDFERLEAGNFRRLANITTLNLNNLSKLTRIEKDSLAGLKGLNAFSCSFNPNLVYIDEDAFGGENSTISKEKTWPHEQLYLQQNGLRTLKSPLSLDSWSSLNFVDLADNPWNCDCNLLWMRELKTETQMNIRCDSPPHLKGRPLHLLGVSDLRCGDQWFFTFFLLSLSVMLAFGLLVLAASTIVCSRTKVGLFVRAKKQFGYAKVTPKTEAVDLEWDPTADM